MVLDAYLAIGGREVVNAARAFGYATTSDCSALWLKDPHCASLSDALEDEPYEFANIKSAPWYDPDQDSLSRRFLGVYGLSIDSLRDSMRTAEVTERADDGARIGGRRVTSRPMRVQVWLTAQGRDALDYGMGWLSASVSADSCDLHNSMCGVTDMSFFTDCPPSYEDVFDVESVITQPTQPLPSMQKASVLWIDTSNGGRVPKRWTGSDAVDGAVQGVASTDGASWFADAGDPATDITNVDFDNGHPYVEAGADEGVLWIGADRISVGTDGVWETVDTVSYIEEISHYQRFLHSVDVTSGPFVVQERESSDGVHVGRLVEFTITAEDGSIYAAPREVGLLPSLPSVVQDTLYNLLPTPSMELTDGSSIVVATNYVTNPSVEVDTTNWQLGTTVGITPDATGVRSTDLAAAGVASFKASTAATNSGTDGVLVAVCKVDMTAVPANVRVSAGMWGTLIRSAGTAVLGSITGEIQFHASDGGGLGTTQIGTVPATGGPMSLPSIQVPAGTVEAWVVGRANITSWSTGAALALYMDAVSVTVP